MTSKKKIESNRRNAQKSTGPINKEKTKFNAVKHGILSGGGVIEEIDGERAKDQFNYLLDQMVKELAPVGFIEDELVYEMAMSKWHTRRLRNYESGLIETQIDRVNDQWGQPSENDPRPHSYINLTDSGKTSLTHYEVAVEKTNRLGAMVEHLESGGRLTEIPELASVLVYVVREFDFNPEDVVDGGNSEKFVIPLHLIEFTSDEVQQVIDAVCVAEGIEEADFRARLLTRLRNNHEIALADQSRQVRGHHQAIRLAILPDPSISALLLRYKTAGFNQFFKLLHELQRLQTSRRRADSNSDLTSNSS